MTFHPLCQVSMKTPIGLPVGHSWGVLQRAHSALAQSLSSLLNSIAPIGISSYDWLPSSYQQRSTSRSQLCIQNTKEGSIILGSVIHYGSHTLCSQDRVDLLLWLPKLSELIGSHLLNNHSIIVPVRTNDHVLLSLVNMLNCAMIMFLSLHMLTGPRLKEVESLVLISFDLLIRGECLVWSCWYSIQLSLLSLLGVERVLGIIGIGKHIGLVHWFHVRCWSIEEYRTMRLVAVLNRGITEHRLVINISSMVLAFGRG